MRAYRRKFDAGDVLFVIATGLFALGYVFQRIDGVGPLSFLP